MTVLNKTIVFYKFFHETDESFKQLDFDVDKITAADLKILIAKATGLEKEFARTFDLKLFLVTNEQDYTGGLSNLQEIVSDSVFVISGSKVVVQRVSWRHRPAIEHVANTEQSNEDNWKSITNVENPNLRPFPPEYVCPLCDLVLSHPVVVRCVSKCGRSACRKCVEDKLKDKRICPFCEGRVQNVIANKALTAIISRLNLEDFDHPKRQENTLQKSIEKQEDVAMQYPPSDPFGVAHALETPNVENNPVTTKDQTSKYFQNPHMINEEGINIKNEIKEIEDIKGNENIASLLSAATPLLKNLSSTLSMLATATPGTSAKIKFEKQNYVPALAENKPSRKTSGVFTTTHSGFRANSSVPGPTKLKQPRLLPNPSSSNIHTAGTGGGILGTDGAPVLTNSKYEFDPVSNSWKPITSRNFIPVNSNVPNSQLLNTSAITPTQVSHETSNVSYPFKSITDLASRFPFLKKKDFLIIRELQKQLKLAMNAEIMLAVTNEQLLPPSIFPELRELPDNSSAQFNATPSVQQRLQQVRPHPSRLHSSHLQQRYLTQDFSEDYQCANTFPYSHFSQPFPQNHIHNGLSPTY